jgi:hypothetical protein
MKNELSASIIMSVIFLAGCNDDESTKSIDWYKSNNQERLDKTTLCKKSTQPRATEDCRNAIDAQQDINPENKTLDNAGQ